MNRLSAALGAVVLSFGQTGVASAADMPVKAPVAAPVSYNWTGFYIGANVGGGWDRTSADHICNDFAAGGGIFGGCGFAAPVAGGTVPPPTSFKGSGWLAGLQAGYNYQIGAVVVGVEADYNWSRIRGAGTSNFLLLPVAGGGPANIVSKQNLDSFGTIRGRLGWLPSQQWLIYATGGVAFGQANRDVTLSGPTIGAAGGGFGFICIAGQPCFQGSAKQSMFGWTVGVGSEWAISTNVTVKAEYLYANLPGASLTAVAFNGAGQTPSSFQTTYGHTELHVARIGINYRFNAAPVVAKY